MVAARIDVEVLQPEPAEVELVDHRRRAERDVVAVADVDGRAGELLARSRSADLGARLEEQRPHAGAREVGRGDETVVSRAHDDGVDVGDRRPWWGS
jgi:hypothetical protein